MDTKARPLPVKGAQREDMPMVTNSYKDLVIKFINNASGKARLLGIWGMASIGKSTLLRQVLMCRSEFHADSDDLLLILFVDTGSDCSIAKVQKALLGLLGLTIAPDVTEAGIALTICNRLMGMSFLVMFDGLSTPINLARIGIPDPPLIPLSAICQKVVFTTQKESVCASMGCHETIQMLCPSEIDAEKIFNHAVGENVMKDKRIASLSRMIINECGRLPEALWKVGQSLSIKEKPEEWEVAVELMRQSKLSMVTYQNDDLIDRLRRNYNDLEENMKDCFLVCSLWSQEENIPIKDLIQWWRGMDLLDEFNGHAEGYAYVRMLQQLSLLERGENTVTSNEDTHVRMNAMIHKVAKRILNDRGVTWAPNSSWRPALTENTWLTAQNAWISKKEVEILSRKKFLEKKLLSNLSVLIARCAITFEHCQLEGIIFLDMKGVRLVTFPLAICMMVKLQYLNLSFTGITAVPLEMENLSNLKHLCLRNNQELVDLPKGLIGKFEKLKEFDIFATGCVLTSFLMNELEEADLNYLMLGLTVNTKSALIALSKIPRVSALYIYLHDLKGYTIINLDMLSDCKKLRELHIVACSVVRLVAQNGDETQDTDQLLSSLQLVAIRHLPNLIEIDFQTMGVSITSLSICDCPRIIDLTWIKGLINLEQLIVTHCRMVKKIVSLDVAKQDMVSLPKLKTIHLEHLGELSVISDVTLKLESIMHFSLFLCGKLVGLPVDERKPKVILDCDKSFWQKILQDGNESCYIIRVA